MKTKEKNYTPENIINSPFAVEGRDYVIMEFIEDIPPKPTKAPSTETKKKMQKYNECRAKGYNQKESAKMIGITEKTAGKYELKRLESVRNNITELDKLIIRLEQKADEPTTSAKDLIQLTAEIERLNEKKKKCI